MLKKARIIAIGDELLNGSIVDTNSPLIAKVLEQMGFELAGITVVRDKIEEIVAALQNGANSADLLITTGGLGPTTDDLTRESISEHLGLPLVEHKRAKAKLEEFFQNRNRPISENNYRQIVFPAGSEVLTNDMGTADAFVSPSTPPIVSLPGVPRELSWLLDNRVLPWIESFFGEQEQKIERRYLRFFGVSESFLGREIEVLALPDSINVSYRPMFPEILITLSMNSSLGVQQLDEAVKTLTEKIGGEFVTASDGTTSLVHSLANLLTEKGLTLAAAESCSGGQIADLLTSIPGASKFFLASAVTYSNESKTLFTNVEPQTILTHGAVSEETAAAMARGIRVRTNADIGVSVSGIAGPDGGSGEKPVGTFFVGLATAAGETAEKFFMPAERNLFRKYAAFTAVDLVRRGLMGLGLKWERR